MKRYFRPAFFFLFLVLSGCAKDSRNVLPQLADTAEQSLDQTCSAVFPGGRWQFTHSISFTGRGAETATVLGVTSLDSDTVACALMTPEGFTLFAAVAGPDGLPEVKRAVPPFDRPSFAAGLIRDVRLIFLPPPAATLSYGLLADNTPVCRSIDPEGGATDIIPGADGCWRIETYTPEGARDRSLVARACRRAGNTLIPENLKLTRYGSGGYSLNMTLITAENLNQHPLS